MIKLQTKNADKTFPEARNALRRFVTQRLPRQGFESEELIDKYIDYSGGHPRDLIRLINISFNLLIDDPVITQSIAERALKRLAGDYQNVIEVKDYDLLAEIDKAPPTYKPISDQSRRLLYDLVLLEYNDSWWQTHPAVRSLPAYAQAVKALDQATPAP